MAKLDEILESLIIPEQGNLSADVARYFLQIRFSEERISQYELLVEKNQGGTLTTAERDELEAFVAANTLLMILKSKARTTLVGRPSAA